MAEVVQAPPRGLEIFASERRQKPLKATGERAKALEKLGIDSVESLREQSRGGDDLEGGPRRILTRERAVEPVVARAVGDRQDVAGGGLDRDQAGLVRARREHHHEGGKSPRSDQIRQIQSGGALRRVLAETVRDRPHCGPAAGVGRGRRYRRQRQRVERVGPRGHGQRDRLGVDAEIGQRLVDELLELGIAFRDPDPVRLGGVLEAEDLKRRIARLPGERDSGLTNLLVVDLVVVNAFVITPARILFLIALVGTTLELLTERFRAARAEARPPGRGRCRRS